jgi:hypothetical protein
MFLFIFNLFACFYTLNTSVKASLIEKAPVPISYVHEMSSMEFSGKINELLALKCLAANKVSLNSSEIMLVDSKIHKSQNFFLNIFKNPLNQQLERVLQQIAHEQGIKKLALVNYLMKTSKDDKNLRIKLNETMLSTLRLSIIHEAHTQKLNNFSKT